MARRGKVNVSISADSSGLKRGVRDAEGDLGRLQRVGVSSSRGLSAGFKAAGGVIAAVGIADQIRQTVQAAEESQVSQRKLETQLKAVGISYKAHAKQIDEVIQKTSQLSGLDDEDLQDAFTNIVRATGNVNQGLKGTAIAADLARAKHIDVAKAGDLVAKVYNGNVGALKRMGIALTPVTTAQDKLKESTKHATVEQTRAAKEADKTATGQKALAELQKRLGGQAEAYGKTAAGAQDRFRVAVENLREKLGTKLLPIITDVTDKAATFVDQMTNGTGAGGRFADKLKEIADRIKPIVKFFTDHPKLIAGAVGAWAIYRGAAAAAVAATRLKLLASFTGLGPRAAAGGVVAGRAFGGAAATSAGTTFGGRAPAALRGGKIAGAFRGAGSALGVIVGAAIVGEIISKIERDRGPILNTIRGLLPFEPTPGTPKVKPYTPSKNAPPYHRDSGPLRIVPDRAPGHSPTGTTPLGRKRPRQSPTGRTPLPKAHGAVVAHAARAATGGAPLAGGIGRTLSSSQIGALWLGAGGDPGAVDVAVAVALAESGGRTDASSHNPVSGGTNMGLWQIDSGSHSDATFDPQGNAAAAVRISGNGRNWGPWETYGSGAYKKFLGRSGGASTTSISGLSTGGGGAPTRSAPTGADYARHAGRRLAPIMRPFERAAGLEGRAARGAASALGTVQHQETIAGRIFGRTDEDLDTIPGRITRVGELVSQRMLANRRLGLQRRQAAAKKRQVTLKRQEIGKLAAQLRRGSRHDRPEIRRRISKLQADIRQLKSEIRQLGDDIDDSQQDVLDLSGEITKVQAGPETPPEPLTGTAAIAGADPYLAGLDKASALAELTPGTEDDVSAARATVKAREDILGYEQTHGFSDSDIADAARALKGARDALDGLTQAVNDNTQQQLDLAKQQRDDVQRALNVSQSQYAVLAKAITAVASGELGGRLGLGFQTPSFAGGVARP